MLASCTYWFWFYYVHGIANESYDIEILIVLTVIFFHKILIDVWNDFLRICKYSFWNSICKYISMLLVMFSVAGRLARPDKPHSLLPRTSVLNAYAQSSSVSACTKALLCARSHVTQIVVQPPWHCRFGDCRWSHNVSRYGRLLSAIGSSWWGVLGNRLGYLGKSNSYWTCVLIENF